MWAKPDDFKREMEGEWKLLASASGRGDEVRFAKKGGGAGGAGWSRVEGGVWKWKVPAAWGSVEGGGKYEANWTSRARRVRMVGEDRSAWDWVVKGKPALSEFDVICCGKGVCITRGEEGDRKFLVWKSAELGEFSEKKERLRQAAERINAKNND